MKLSCLIPFSVLKEKGTWNSYSLAPGTFLEFLGNYFRYDVSFSYPLFDYNISFISIMVLFRHLLPELSSDVNVIEMGLYIQDTTDYTADRGIANKTTGN
jgi:hypothetical protein